MQHDPRNLFFSPLSCGICEKQRTLSIQTVFANNDVTIDVAFSFNKAVAVIGCAWFPKGVMSLPLAAAVSAPSRIFWSLCWPSDTGHAKPPRRQKLTSSCKYPSKFHKRNFIPSTIHQMGLDRAGHTILEQL